MPTVDPGIVQCALYDSQTPESALLRGLQVEERERLNSMAGTTFSLPGCENIDLILAATGMGECICIRKRCLVLLLGMWLCAGLPGFMYILAHTQQSIHGSRGKFQIARVAGLLMCCLRYWEDITRGNFKYRPVNLQSFKKEQRKMQARNIR